VSDPSIQTGRYDVMACLVWASTDRAKQVSFSKPVCYSPIFAYARSGDNRFTGHLEKINSNQVTISTVDGATAAVIAQADFPKAKQLSMPQMTDLAQDFVNLSTGKADIVFCEPHLAAMYLRNNPNTIENISGTTPVRIFPNCWIFKRGEFEFKAMLDTVLDELINNGTLDRLIDKYEPVPKAVFRVALPYQQSGKDIGPTIAGGQRR